ncbi:hypothetical protein [Granulosicoccus antarcticus]|uniref:Uncharacterized protein n=1 Tax=Granulosicoccus antarcticus IMCC3135 TaxID=1192854 RepID=A0A2Z2NXQ3_9GAMM|nr:hypothetical protein [Granulosicoccus antarcticus]ASJ76236.1 hypothetical protein IMCC3135_30935 [Granulosicoccus antarcticus IMCC3135]
MVSVRSQQSGFAILLMVFVLLGVGLTGLGQVSGLHRVSGSAFTTDQYALQAARQSLLSYAALYPFHYGARGAGPGHLPCPDTDFVRGAPWEQSSGRDGPNPPCGSGSVANGQLPRHVNLGAHRYLFHIEPFQRLEYSVSSGVINNPVNRIVNDQIIRGEPTASPFLAWVRQPPVEQGPSKKAFSKIAITRRSLLPGVKRSVSAWFVWQVNHHAANVCLPLPSPSEWAQGLDPLSLIATRETVVTNQPASESVSEESEPCLERLPPDSSEEGWELEGVPLDSHWFVRNRWYERIVISASEPCRGEVLGICNLVLDEDRADFEQSGDSLGTGKSDERLHFIWRVI